MAWARQNEIGVTEIGNRTLQDWIARLATVNSPLRNPFCRGLILCVGLWSSAQGMDVVTFREGETTKRIEGRVLISAADGGVLLEGRDGSMWPVTGEQVISREENEMEFTPYTREELKLRLRRELPTGFDFLDTNHYLVAFDTSRVYAQWCAGLYERLYRAFQNYWRKRGVELNDPTYPLVAVIFERQADYMAQSEDELGAAASAVVGFYSLKTNRINTFDLTGTEAVRGHGRPRTATLINQVLSQPSAEPNVATIVHEATHQLAYNNGLQTRYAANPLWLSEGLAVYFETPDLNSSKGWRGIGNINWRRLGRFQNYLRNRPHDSLPDLLTGDARFRNSEQALDAYAESWALCYFLLKKHQKQFVAYVSELSEQKMLEKVAPEDHIRLFRKHFGDLTKLDTEFVHYISRLR
jgi:hypothetical protein